MAGKLRSKARDLKRKLTKRKHDARSAADSEEASIHSADSFAVTEMDTLSGTTLDDPAAISEAGLEDLVGDESDSGHRYVRIILYAGRTLLAKDRNGYSDPYVEGRLAGERLRSRIVQQTTNPNWNQEFVLRMAQSENAQDHVLKLTAWDYDGPHRSPDFLGQLRLPLADLLNSRPDIKATDKTWYQLAAREDGSGRAQGDMCVGLEFITHAQARQLQVTQGQGADASSAARYSTFSLALTVHGVRGAVQTLTSGVRNGLFVEARVGSFSSKTATVKETRQEGEYELEWDKQVLVHMDDALRVPKTSGLFNTVAHHFYENAYENLRRNGAFDEVRLILKREKGTQRRGRGRGVNIVGITHFPLSQVPIQDPQQEEATPDEATEAAQAANGSTPQSVKQRLSAVSMSVKDTLGHALHPLVAAMQPNALTQTAAVPAGVDTDVKLEAVDEGQEAAKQSAEQRFWLPLERTGGRRAGELCVSFLLCKEVAGEAVVEDEDDEEEAPDAPEPPPLAWPAPLEEALVDEELPASTRQLWKLMLGTESEVTSDFYKVRKYWDINVGQWTAKEGKRVRQVEYTMPLKKNALGPSEAYNIEQYTVAAKEPGGWIVNIEVNTPKVPYGTAFHSTVQWACSHAGRGKCKLRVTGQVEFTKGCFVKGVITKATQEGMREAYATYMDVLRQKLGTAAPVSAATVAQKVQDSSEGMHGRLGSVQVLLTVVLAVLLLLSWAVWRLDRHSRRHSELLQRLASGAGEGAVDFGQASPVSGA